MNPSVGNEHQAHFAAAYGRHSLGCREDSSLRVLVHGPHVVPDDGRALICQKTHGRPLDVLAKASVVAGVLDLLRLPQNVKTFTASKPQTHLLEQYKVALHGQSFKEKETSDNLAFTYAPAVSNYTNIGVLHTALQGGFGNHKTYAPCTVDELHGRQAAEVAENAVFSCERELEQLDALRSVGAVQAPSTGLRRPH